MENKINLQEAILSMNWDGMVAQLARENCPRTVANQRLIIRVLFTTLQPCGDLKKYIEHELWI